MNHQDLVPESDETIASGERKKTLCTRSNYIGVGYTPQCYQKVKSCPVTRMSFWLSFFSHRFSKQKTVLYITQDLAILFRFRPDTVCEEVVIFL